MWDFPDRKAAWNLSSALRGSFSAIGPGTEFIRYVIAMRISSEPGVGTLLSGTALLLADSGSRLEIVTRDNIWKYCRLN